MPYNENIAEQVRVELADAPDVSEIKMYGGIAFMVRGKMCICVGGSDADNVMVRVGPERYEAALKRPGTAPTIMKNRPIRGYVDLDHEGRKDLTSWAALALKFNE